MSLYDQSTFQGRLKHFLRLTNPLTLLASQQDIQNAQMILQDPRSQKDDAYWNAKYLIDSSIHPDTKEPILLPFRMSSFVPTNLVVTAGLLIPNASVATTVLWQIINQSVNVGINYSNGNKSSPISSNQLLFGYASAVGASVSLAVGLNKFATGRLKMFIPFLAVSSAGCVNVFCMRQQELINGISVKNPDGSEVGKSVNAGWKAVTQVAASRVATSLPCLTIPPIVLAMLEKRGLFRGKTVRLAVANFGLITICLLTALPCAIAMFPQEGRMLKADLERELQSNVKGSYVTFNKGL